MEQMSNEDLPSYMDPKVRALSGIERAFDSSKDIQPPSLKPSEPSLTEDFIDPLLKDREEYIKMYQAAVMSYIRSLLKRASVDQVDLSQEVGVVWSNLVKRLLSGNFKSFRQTKNEKSFRAWIRPLIHAECKTHLQLKNPDGTPLDFDTRSVQDQENEQSNLTSSDRTLEEVLRKTVIDRAYNEIEGDGLYGAAVLFAAKKTEGFTYEELANHLSEKGGKPVTVEASKKRLQRGRELFAQTLIEQAARLDGTEDLDRIEVILVELDLLAHCKKALANLRA